MNSDYARIVTAIRLIDQHVYSQPNLDELARALHLSPFHFQRLFRRWCGVTPKRFLQFLTVEHAKEALRASSSVLEAAHQVGLSGPGRLHDHFVSLEAVTPGDYKHNGAGLTIHYGIHPSPFGPALLAITERGVCALAFVDEHAVEQSELARLQRAWPEARLLADQEATAPVARRIFQPRHDAPEKLTLCLRGTNFQINVWKALLQIPAGQLSSYEQVAIVLGKPQARRAVGQAVAANPVGYLIPCHRVIRSVGAVGGYRWGSVRKRALIGWEAARTGAAAEPTSSAIFSSSGRKCP